MKIDIRIRFISILMSISTGFLGTAFACEDINQLVVNTITPLFSIKKLKEKMIASEPPACHSYLKDLDIVKVKYIDFHEKERTGVILVHKELSQDILDIFQTLYQHHFPIADIHPSGNKPNTTIGYNCRFVSNQPGILSQHSFGRAIDINPLINPYVKGEQVLPKEGKPYANRKQQYKGMITKESVIYKLFEEHGWDWGGNWLDVQDYQHFEKRENGKKRNPFGYIPNALQDAKHRLKCDPTRWGLSGGKSRFSP